MCRYCSNLPVCALLHRAIDGGTQESADIAGIGSAFASLDHLNERHLEYLRSWNTMLDLEFGSITDIKSEVWRYSSDRRQRLGRCFANVAPFAVSRDNATGAFLYRFQRQKRTLESACPSDPEGPRSFLELQLSEGDSIVVSVEGGPFAVAAGRLEDLNSDTFVVRLQKPLTARPLQYAPTGAAGRELEELIDIEALGCHAGAARPSKSTAGEWQSLKDDDGSLLSAACWRVDKDESRAGYGLLKENLSSLFLQKEFRLRELVVDLAVPAFSPREVADTLLADPRVKALQVFEALNSDQLHALRAVLTAQDYVLLLGMPGTGKTTCIAVLVRVLLALGQSVLVTAHTHTAVDNILLKLQEMGVDFLRVGNPSQVHADLQRHTIHGAGKIDSLAQLKARLMGPQLVGSTCLGVSHPLFSKRGHFDVVIVDEASQLSEAACLGPIRFGRSFVLVGDHNQLPPVVKNVQARALGMSTPLFQRLCEAHPAAKVELETQYRMAADIMLLSNSLVYSNRLRCGSDDVATATLKVPWLDQVIRESQMPAWLTAALNPCNRVLFLDTDTCPALESRGAESVHNDGEARLVSSLVTTLISAGVNASDMGVISPYRSQVRLIASNLRNALGPGVSATLDVHTIDKYQGRDKACILISFVRSNQSSLVGDLLRDWRRLNVAFTRARCKLVMVGSRATLAAEPFFERLFSLLIPRSWVYPLPSNGHLFVVPTPRESIR
eukprot:tig00000852_g5051.t1